MERRPDRGAGPVLRPANLDRVPGLRRLAALALVLGAVAAGVPAALGHDGDLDAQKHRIDDRIAGLRSQIDAAKSEEGVLTVEIQSQTARIRALEKDIAKLNAKVAKLESELAARRAELEKLQEVYRYQTERLGLLAAQQAEAQRRLEARLVALYETEQPDALAVILQSGSLNDLIEQIQLLNDIGKQDRRIAEEIAAVRADAGAARRETARTKAALAKVTAALAGKTADQRAVRDAVVGREQSLAGARATKEDLLASVREERRDDEENLEEMLAASAEIAAKIKAALAAAAAASGSSSSAGSGVVPAGGFIWPVQGVVTSAFGPRWGRMHEGIDIAAPAGTPIRAAAAGTVIYAGWLGGYGNLTIIDHGNGVATAYGHQSAIYVTGGAVSQGQEIGAVGSTGHSTGDHLHFEVRINATPVDPLAYL